METIQDQWKACQQLGIDQRILDVLVHNNHHSKPYCFKLNKTNSIWSGFGLDKFKNKKNNSELPKRNPSKECQRGCCAQTDGNNKGGILSTYFDQNHLNHFSLKETLTDQEIKIIGEAIDWFLHFEYIETLSYHERSLVDFYWSLDRVKKKKKK